MSIRATKRLPSSHEVGLGGNHRPRHRDKASLDIFWLKDESLADLENLPEPEELLEQIIENVEAALACFQEINL